jgi:LIVCS family branched-chain amino acid:cation transporter
MLTPLLPKLNMARLNHSDLLALGFMTFALFLGAGNIIFPPLAGRQAGAHLLPAAIGFLITAVGLPLLTVVALARVGGGMPALTAPLGQGAGTAMAVAVYLVIGPLFATPRAAVASFEIGISPFSGVGALALSAYTSVFFLLVWALVLFPGRLIDMVGKLITPVLIVALILLGAAGLWLPAGPVAPPQGDYVTQPLLKGFLEGYLTMDALGALVFGIVIATAVRDRGVFERRLVTRYSVIAVLIAATALALVYLSLFYLGAGSAVLAQGTSNGGQLLTRYVQHTFGTPGLLLLAVVIVLACLTTAVGLMTACGEYFGELLGQPYRRVATAFVLLSLLISNVGLTQLIQFSIPVLMGLYPLAIMLVVLSLADGLWRVSERVFRPVMAVTCVFGVADGLNAAGIGQGVATRFFQSLPLADVTMGWVLPAAITLLIAAGADRLRKPHPQIVD